MHALGGREACMLPHKLMSPYPHTRELTAAQTLTLTHHTLTPIRARVRASAIAFQGLAPGPGVFHFSFLMEIRCFLL